MIKAVGSLGPVVSKHRPKIRPITVFVLLFFALLWGFAWFLISHSTDSLFALVPAVVLGSAISVPLPWLGWYLIRRRNDELVVHANGFTIATPAGVKSVWWHDVDTVQIEGDRRDIQRAQVFTTKDDKKIGFYLDMQGRDELIQQFMQFTKSVSGG